MTNSTITEILGPIVDWVKLRSLPRSEDLLRVSLLTIDDILRNPHPDDPTKDVWATTVALRLRYVRSVKNMEQCGSDKEKVIQDFNRTDYVHPSFIESRTRGLEEVLAEMDRLLGL